MAIKHIVICGGGPTGFLSYGALKMLNEKGFWKKDDLLTMYGTSIGGIMSVITVLGYNWEAIDDYLIKRPWMRVFDKVSNDILDLINNKGIDGVELAKIVLEPLLKARDLTIDTTLKQLYEAINIKIVLTATNMNGDSNKLEGELLSYETYPDMKVYEAIAATSALPMSFRPVIYKDKCFVDGGLLHNLPIQKCIDHENADEDEILAIHNKWNTEYPKIDTTMGFLEYMKIFTRRSHNSLDSSSIQPTIKHYLKCDASSLYDYSVWLEIFNNEEMREELIKSGANSAQEWLKELEGEVGETE